MIQASRSDDLDQHVAGRLPPQSSGASRRHPRIRALWHAICIPFMMSGCLILGGPYYLIENTPPEQITVQPRGAIIVDSQFRTVLIEYFDADDDELSFNWYVGGALEDRPGKVLAAPRSGANGENIQGSVLTLDRSELFDGMEVRCLVSDGDPGREAIDLRWVVVLQEAA